MDDLPRPQALLPPTMRNHFMTFEPSQGGELGDDAWIVITLCCLQGCHTFRFMYLFYFLDTQTIHFQTFFNYCASFTCTDTCVCHIGLNNVLA